MPSRPSTLFPLFFRQTHRTATSWASSEQSGKVLDTHLLGLEDSRGVVELILVLGKPTHNLLCRPGVAGRPTWALPKTRLFGAHKRVATRGSQLHLERFCYGLLFLVSCIGLTRTRGFSLPSVFDHMASQRNVFHLFECSKCRANVPKENIKLCGGVSTISAL